MTDCRIIHGDALAVLPTLTERIDAVVTDPPYGVGKADWDSVFPTEWIALCEQVSPRMLTMPGLTNLHTALRCISDYRDCIALWARNGMTRGPIGFGNWIPVVASGDWPWKARQNLLPFNVDTSELIDHPSPKPLAAMVALILAYTEPEWMILDPFCGSGTTGVACAMTGRNFIGIEIDERYCAIARRRIAEAAPLFRQPREVDPELFATMTTP